MVSFFAQSITLLSAAFSLGSVSYLYIRYRTRLLRMVLLFLLSLLAISIGFWINSRPFHELSMFAGGMEAIHLIFQMLGGGLNIIILPHLVSALLSIPLNKLVKSLLWVWNSAFIILAAISFLFPHVTIIPILLSVQQIATIFGCLVFMGFGIRHLKNRWWRSAFVSFYIVSSIFLLLLVLDILISSLPIAALYPIDNLSLPLYLIALNSGIYYFSGKFLSREALVKNGKLTASCVEFYQLTVRETEIIEELIQGRTNNQVAEHFFISVKTVENHLYNIYQKVDVRGRLQLLHTLNSWGSE